MSKDSQIGRMAPINEVPRKEREKLQHRREILEAAERLFASKGYHRTNVQEIAEEAEFSVGYLYNLFENKMELYFQLTEMRIDEYLALVEQKVNAVAGPLEKIRIVIGTKLDFFREKTQFFRIFSHLTAGGRPEMGFGMSKRCRENCSQHYERLADVFREGIRKGVFVDADPLLMVFSLEGMTNAVIASWVATGGKELAVARPEELEDLFFRGVLAEGNR